MSDLSSNCSAGSSPVLSLLTDRPAAHCHAGALVCAVDDALGYCCSHQGKATPTVLGPLGDRPPATAITNGQLGHSGTTRYDGDAAIDLNVAPHPRWVGMLHNIRRGLTDGQDQVLKLRIGPLMRFQPLAKPVSDQRQRRRLCRQHQLEPDQ